MPSRRAVLAGGGAVALVGVSTGVASQVHLDPFESWSPPADAWPLARRDPAATAANPAASVPADPAVAWRRSVVGSSHETAVVVGPEAVYASDVGTQDGVAALERGDGTVRWRDDALGGRVALHEGTLYAVHTEESPASALFALDAAGGDRRWQADYGRAAADALVPAGGTVVVGGDGDLRAYGTDGGRRWAFDGPDQRTTGVAVADGAAFATVGDRAVRLRSRSLLDAALLRRPPSAWVSTPVDGAGVPAVAGGRVVVGSRVEVGADRPAIAAYDAATGQRVGGALRPGDVPTPSGATHFDAATPALVGDRAVAPYSFAVPPSSGGSGGDDGGRSGEEPGEHGVVAVSLVDGAVQWRRALADAVRDVAVASDAVVVATGPTPERGAVLALDPADGSERWRVALDSGVGSVAAVDGAVFAGLDAGDAAALR